MEKHLANTMWLTLIVNFEFLILGKYNPLYLVSNDQPVRTELQFENTKHRYSWLCSIRNKDESKKHICAATLLRYIQFNINENGSTIFFILNRRSPGPTVFVTSAHCTFLCKSGPNILDNCCCENVGGYDCSKNTTQCGNNPTVIEMTGIEIYIMNTFILHFPLIYFC